MNNYFLLNLLLLCFQLSFAQERIIHGKVTDSAGSPIPYANIFIEKTKTQSATDLDGNYAIKINSSSYLIFSYLGFKSQKIAADKEKINVVLEMDHSKLLEELPYIPHIRKKKTQKIKVQ